MLHHVAVAQQTKEMLLEVKNSFQRSLETRETVLATLWSWM
jgi:hypothetical protein